MVSVGTVHFRKTNDAARKPERHHHGDAGWDLYVSQKVLIAPGAWSDVHSDIEIALPSGIWALVTGRSSAFRKRGLQVQTGIIDAGYRGEIFVAVWNPTQEYQTIEVGDRIAQLIPFDRCDLKFREVEELGESDRGNAGFGSTGP